MNEHLKIPPQAIEIEESLIGAILLDSECLDDVVNIIHPDCFYKDSHKKIYNAIERLYKRSESIDILTICEVLRNQNELDSVGGPFYVTNLTSQIASTAHAEYHARIIKEKYLKREFIRISSELMKLSFEENDLNEITNFAERELLKITDSSQVSEAYSISSLIPKTVEEVEKIQTSKVRLQGVPSGLTKLDRITGGWKNSNLIILAARPSMGKTALALEFAYNCASIFGPCIFFSLEMSKEELAMRMLTSASEIDSDKINNGTLNTDDWKKINIAMSRFNDIGLYIDESVGLNVFDLRSKCRRYKKKYNPKLIVIDYLQLVDGDNQFKGNDNKLVGSVSRMCKMIAKELDLPVILLSQLNRNVETRSNKFPEMSDLRSSGEIEQDADMIIFPTRYKRIGELETDDLKDATNLAKLDVKKNRNGKTGYCDVWVSDDVSRWRDEEEINEIVQPF